MTKLRERDPRFWFLVWNSRAFFFDILGSDDCTCYIWEPARSKDPLHHMTGTLTKYGYQADFLGHSKLINIVSFSPDGNLIASAAFDKNIRLWNKNGKYVQEPKLS